jgi:hypothetical protein
MKCHNNVFPGIYTLLHQNVIVVLIVYIIFVLLWGVSMMKT